MKILAAKLGVFLGAALFVFISDASWRSKTFVVFWLSAAYAVEYWGPWELAWLVGLLMQVVLGIGLVMYLKLNLDHSPF